MPTRSFPALFVIALLAAAPAAQPQDAWTGTLRGAVVDAQSGAPLVAATVALYLEAESSFVTGATTGPDGTFELGGLQPAPYALRISFVGYRPQRREVVVGDGESYDLGSVPLSPRVDVLGGARVTAERATVEQRADRTVYNVKDDPVTTGGNALNTLETLPSIEVDQDGTLSLRGGRNVAVQINGRPTPMTGAFLASFLRQIPAETIDRVEVLPTPGASEEASGMSGIINIVLKEKAPDRGLAGGVALTGGTLEAGLSANVNYNRGSLDLSGAYGFGGNRVRGLSTADRTYLDPDGPFASFEREEPNERLRGGHFANATLVYTLRPGSVLSANINGFTGADDRDETATTVFRLRTGADSSSVREVTQDGRASSVQGNLRLDQSFDEDGGHTLTAEVRTSRSADGLDEATTDGPGRGSPTSYTEDQTITEAVVEVDYERTVGAVEAELGARAERESVESGARLSAPTSPLTDGTLDYERTVLAVYAQAAAPLGPRVEVQGGLRVESTDRSFTLDPGEFGDGAGSFSRTYANLFPSAFAVYTFAPGTLLKGAYSRRINRPSTRLLSPFTSQADPFTQRRGNAALEPEFTDAYELTAQYKYILTVTPFLRRTTDVIQRTFTQEGETTFFTPVNAGTQRSYGVDLTLASSVPGLPARGFLSGSVFRDEFSGVQNAFENTSYTLRASVRAELSETTTLALFGFFRGPRAIEGGSSSGYGFTSLALSRKLRGDALVLNIRVTDPLSTTRFEFDTTNGRFDQFGASDPDRRGIAATLTWVFGEESRRRRPSNNGGGDGDEDDFGI